MKLTCKYCKNIFYKNFFLCLLDDFEEDSCGDCKKVIMQLEEEKDIKKDNEYLKVRKNRYKYFKIKGEELCQQ